MAKQTVHLMIGNIGTGKSTVAKKLLWDYPAVYVCMDEIQAMLAGGKYNLYNPDWKPVYYTAETGMIHSALQNGQSVVIDRTNIDRESRERFLEAIHDYDVEVHAWDMGPGTHLNLTYRTRDPRGVDPADWESVFEAMRADYEEPVKEEGFDHIHTLQGFNRFKVYAWDFDGTLAEHTDYYPDIGKPIKRNVDRLKDLWADKRNLIVIWTCRDGEAEKMMIRYLHEHDIPYDGINENMVYATNSRKIFADVYYDDRNAV